MHPLTASQAFKPDGISLDILFALSAFGNLIAVVYTSARGTTHNPSMSYSE